MAGIRASLRLRLALWYSGALVFVLVAFAALAFLIFVRSLDSQIDQLLVTTANALAQALAAEQEEPGAETDAGEEVAREARDFQLQDLSFIVCDQSGRLVFAPEALSSRCDDFSRQPLAERAYNTVRLGDGWWRTYQRTAVFRGVRYRIVALHALRNRRRLLERLTVAFGIAILVASLFAAASALLIAHRALAPIAEMSARAAHIGASNLNERLPVANHRDELGQLAAVINDLLARLEAAFAQQRRFMADASHELRTPIAVICGETEVALSCRARPPDDLRESLRIVHVEGRRMSRIIEDLLLLARADAGQYPLVISDFYLDEAIADTARALRVLAAQRAINLDVKVDGELPFRGDQGLIRRMAANLLDNAIKYAPPRSIVRVVCARRGDAYTLAFSDAGPGIAPEDAPRIFERFWRADKARSRGGAGLGLAIARWIAEVHGGRLELACSDARGSTFVATLPARFFVEDARATTSRRDSA